MTGSCAFILSGDHADQTLAFSGPMVAAELGAVDAQLRGLHTPIARIDLSGVGRIDTVGAWVICRLADTSGAALVGARQDVLRLVEAVRCGEANRVETRAPRLPLFSRVPLHVGQVVMEMALGSITLLAFLGRLVMGLGGIVRQPWRMRGNALIHQMELVGVNALAIIGLMSFLVGIVIAQQGATQLQQFGAEIYTVDLVGRLSLRELGILMTAIMVAGRSGSAFAAEIGTMKLTEEIDAMRTIGLDPMETLVLPRLIATMIMLPLLGIYAAVIGIIGGATISAVALDIPFFTFLERIRHVVPLYDVWVGLIKAPVFGFIVAVSGCFHGMQVKSDSEEVGIRTTAAVVMAIFTVIVLDAFFAVFFSGVGWG